MAQMVARGQDDLVNYLGRVKICHMFNIFIIFDMLHN